MTRRKNVTNCMLHLKGTPGTGSATARVSGHLVLQRLGMLQGWAGSNFAGAVVMFTPGMTIYALDVCKCYRLDPSGEWIEHTGPAATPDIEPPRPIAQPPTRPAMPAQRPRPAGRRPPARVSVTDILQGARLARSIFHGLR